MKDGGKLEGAHSNAIMDFDWHNSLLVSGDKNGLLVFWVIFPLLLEDIEYF